MRHSSGRAQVEPLAVLAAVLAVSAGLTIYTGVLDDTVPKAPESETPAEILDGVQRSLAASGVSSPTRLGEAMTTVPDGWHANVTLTAGGRQWHEGPVPPASAQRERRRVSVKLGPQRIEPGQLRVVVWR